MCQRCGFFRMQTVADLGTMVMVKCLQCGHTQLRPNQAVRGVRLRDGEVEKGNEFSN